jgi:hypothetical protein
MHKKIFNTLIITFIIALFASGCSSVPNRSSEVGNPNPSEDTIVDPFNSTEIDPDISLEFSSSLTLEGIEEGSFELTEADEVVASLSVSEVDVVTRNTISSCETDAMNWTGFKSCWVEGILYAVSDDVDKMVTFEFFADDIEKKIRLVSIYENMSVKTPDTSNMSDTPASDPDGPKPGLMPIGVNPDSLGWATPTTVDYEFDSPATP